MTSSFTNKIAWTLEKTDVISPLVRYRLIPESQDEIYSSQMIFDIIKNLLSGKCVGIMAQGGCIQSLSKLSDLWHDGRVLRRMDEAAFVCIEPHFSLSVPLARVSCLSGVCLDFALFSQNTPEDSMFKCMLDTHTDAPLRLEIMSGTGEMILILHTKQIKEDDFYSMLENAVLKSGISLKYSA